MEARAPQERVVLRAPTAENRRPLDTFPAYMRQLGKAVLDGHHDIKFHKAAEQRATAENWGRRRGYTLGPDVDINDDGVNDVVLYDSKGKPVVINGYALKKSEFMLRKKYHEDNPDAGAKKLVGGYSGFKRSFRNDPAAEAYQNTFSPGYAKLRKSPVRDPDAGPSLYNRFCEIVNNSLFTMLNEQANEVNPVMADIANIALPKQSIYSLYYVDTILKYLWRHVAFRNEVQKIYAKYRTPEKRLEMFRKCISKRSPTVETIIEDEHVFDMLREYFNDVEHRIPEFAELGLDVNALTDDNAEIPFAYDGHTETIESKAWLAGAKEFIAREAQNAKERTIGTIFSLPGIEENLEPYEE